MNPDYRPPRRGRDRRRLSTVQIACFIILWFFLVYIILTSAQTITGTLVLSIIISGVIVAIPILRELKKRRTEGGE